MKFNLIILKYPVLVPSTQISVTILLLRLFSYQLPAIVCSSSKFAYFKLILDAILRKLTISNTTRTRINYIHCRTNGFRFFFFVFFFLIFKQLKIIHTHFLYNMLCMPHHRLIPYCIVLSFLSIFFFFF